MRLPEWVVDGVRSRSAACVDEFVQPLRRTTATIVDAQSGAIGFHYLGNCATGSAWQTARPPGRKIAPADSALCRRSN
jgi:hypothetical protein